MNRMKRKDLSTSPARTGPGDRGQLVPLMAEICEEGEEL